MYLGIPVSSLSLAEIAEVELGCCSDLPRFTVLCRFLFMYEVILKQLAFVAPYVEENCSHSLSTQNFFKSGWDLILKG
jgi:hypothetical protein